MVFFYIGIKLVENNLVVLVFIVKCMEFSYCFGNKGDMKEGGDVYGENLIMNFLSVSWGRCWGRGKRMEKKEV